MAGLTKKGKVYYAVLRINDKTVWKRIGIVSYKEAKEYIRKLESRTDREKLGLTDIKPIAFIDYATLYLNYSRTNKSQGSWERDITSLKALGGYFGKLNLEYIDNEKIEHYKAARQGKGKSNRTINIELTCLSPRNQTPHFKSRSNSLELSGNPFTPDCEEQTY